jgi:PAS domain S-box-containing protein
MTVLNSPVDPTAVTRPRPFPSKLVVVAAVELTLIAVLLRWSNSPAFFAAAIACSLGAIQLGAVLIARFRRDTRKVRRVAQAAEFSSQAVLITDPRGRIKWINSRFTDLTGFRMDDATGKTFSMLLHGQFTDTPTVELIRNQLRTGQPFNCEILQYNRAGEEFWVASKGEPFCDAQGQITHYVITQSDLPDHRRQTREIEQLAAIAVDRAIETEALTPAVAVNEYPANDPALRLAQQLESLSSADDRAQLQDLVDGLKARVIDCVTILPAPVVEPSTAQSSD